MDSQGDPRIHNEPLIVDRRLGAANADLTHRSRPVTHWGQLVGVFVVYSAAVSLNVDIILEPAVGSAYVVRLTRLVLVADTTAWWLPEKDLRLAQGDVVRVDAPAGGASVTATASIYIDSGRTRFEGLEELLLPWLVRVR